MHTKTDSTAPGRSIQANSHVLSRRAAVPERWRIGTWAGAGRRPCCDVMRANVRRDFEETVGQLSLVAMPPGGAGSRGALRRVQWHPRSNCCTLARHVTLNTETTGSILARNAKSCGSFLVLTSLLG
jgi:hypothetical protein